MTRLLIALAAITLMAQQPSPRKTDKSVWDQYQSAISAPVWTNVTVTGEDGMPCRVTLIQPSGPNINVMNMETNCPRHKEKAAK